MRAPSQTTSAFCSRSSSDHASSRSACENALLPYSDDSSATTSSVTAAASAATAALRTARSMSTSRYSPADDIVALGDADGELASGVAGGERLRRLGGTVEGVGVLDAEFERAAVEQLRDAIEVGHASPQSPAQSS